MATLADQLRATGFAELPRSRRVPVSRASFALTDRTAFDEAVRLATAWIERTARCELPVDAHQGKAFVFDPNDGVASASALRLDDEQGSIWTGRIAYRGDTTADRTWLTELFVEQRRGAFARFGAQLNCECLQSDPGFEHSRPRIIKDVLQRLAAEADGVALSDFVEPISMDGVADLVSLLYDSSRRLPIVLVSVDNAGGAQVNLSQLATRLSGAAHLRSIAIEEAYELTRTIGSRMSTYQGALRVYMPNLEQDSEDPFKHPLWLAPASGLNHRVLNQVASRVLPLGFRDSDGDSRFWRMGLLRQAVSRAAADEMRGTQEDRLTAEVEALRFERDSALEEAQSAESLMSEEAQKAELLQAELEKLRSEAFSLRERLRSTEAFVPTALTTLSPDDVNSLFNQDPSLEVCLRVVASVFPGRITLLDSAFESARDSFAFQHRKKAFSLLWLLCTDYWTSLAGGEGDVVAKRCFGSSYAAREASSISSAGRKKRTFLYQEAPIEMDKHLKIGVADNKAETLRIHFEWVSVEKRIVLGYCGAHIDF